MPPRKPIPKKKSPTVRNAKAVKDLAKKLELKKEDVGHDALKLMKRILDHVKQLNLAEMSVRDLNPLLKTLLEVHDKTTKDTQDAGKLETSLSIFIGRVETKMAENDSMIDVTAEPVEVKLIDGREDA